MKEKKSGKFSEKKIKDSLKPLLKFKKYIEAIYVFGSSIKKKNAYDIDVMIIVNDTKKVMDREIKVLENVCDILERSAAKKGIMFHFQPIKVLSKWWHLLIEGEPWIISSLKNILVIYDKKDMLKEVRGFIKKEHLYKKEERAEKLLERSDKTHFKNRQLLLNSIINLVNAGTEAAQILFLFDNKFILNKNKIVNELNKPHYKKKIGSDEVGSYKELVDLEEKMEKGTLSEFSAENLDYYLEKIKNFINKVEAVIGK